MTAETPANNIGLSRDEISLSSWAEKPMPKSGSSTLLEEGE